MKKKVEINYTEGEGEDKLEITGAVTLKRLDYGEKNMLDEEITDIKVYGNTPQVKVSSKKMKELSLLKSVVECDLKKTTYEVDRVTKQLVPIRVQVDLNSEGITHLPTEVGNMLFIEFTDLNTVSDKKKVV